eukprot:8319526-Lingulodinium_polyedra.AAC.1
MRAAPGMSWSFCCEKGQTKCRHGSDVSSGSWPPPGPAAGGPPEAELAAGAPAGVCSFSSGARASLAEPVPPAVDPS